jgi:hypothetical protein
MTSFGNITYDENFIDTTDISKINITYGFEKSEDMNFSVGSIVGMYTEKTPDGTIDLFDSERYLKELYENKNKAQLLLDNIESFKDSTDYIDNNHNKKLTDKAVGELKYYIGSLSKLENKVLRNIMVENTIQVLFDSDNMIRMTTPISTEFINGKSDPNSIVSIFEKLNIAKDRFEFEPNLALPTDSQKMFKNVFDGQSLTGIMANSIKVMSYILRTGDKNAPPKIKESLQISLDGVTHDQMSEIEIRPDSESSLTSRPI